MVASDISGMVFVETKAKSADGLAISRILVSTHGIVPLPQPSNRPITPPREILFSNCCKSCQVLLCNTGVIYVFLTLLS